MLVLVFSGEDSLRRDSLFIAENHEKLVVSLVLSVAKTNVDEASQTDSAHIGEPSDDIKSAERYGYTTLLTISIIHVGFIVWNAEQDREQKHQYELDCVDCDHGIDYKIVRLQVSQHDLSNWYLLHESA